MFCNLWNTNYTTENFENTVSCVPDFWEENFKYKMVRGTILEQFLYFEMNENERG